MNLKYASRTSVVVVVNGYFFSGEDVHHNADVKGFCSMLPSSSFVLRSVWCLTCVETTNWQTLCFLDHLYIDIF